MNIEQSRFNMVEQQIRPWNVLNQDVLDLLFVVKREEFVPAEYRALAFADLEIPLPEGENMLPPKTEARILQALALAPQETVLEIGTGSGYMAALLAHQARHVTTVEINPKLKKLAENNLAQIRINNLQVILADGLSPSDLEDDALYDAIVLSGSLPILPEYLLHKLVVGGRLVAVIGEAPVMTAQLIMRIEEKQFKTINLFETYVKPLIMVKPPSHFVF